MPISTPHLRAHRAIPAGTVRVEGVANGMHVQPQRVRRRMSLIAAGNGFATAWNGLEDIDRMILSFLGAAGLASAGRAPATVSVLIAATGAALLVIACWARRSVLGRLVHDFAPVAAIVGMFELAGPTIEAARSSRYDEILAGLDQRYFETIGRAWNGMLGRPDAFTDLMHATYVSFYVLPIAVGVVLFWRGRRAAFHVFVFDVVATFLASFVGYFVFPATGPRVPIELEDVVIGGGAFSRGVRAFLHVMEKNTLDAFPSGHAAVAIVIAWSTWRLLPRAGIAVTLVASGIVVSTVYMHVHYVVDVVAGDVLASLMIVLLSRRSRAV
jgi:membrane-associated phospholipid phosphatase